MKSKIGRPKLPKGEAKDVQIGVRFTPNDSQQIKKVMASAGINQTKAEWIRDAARLVAAASVICDQYSVEELDEKSVRFRIRLLNGCPIEGSGKIMALKRGDGSMKIQIESRYKHDAPNAYHRFLMPQAAVPWLKKLPPKARFDFELNDPTV